VRCEAAAATTATLESLFMSMASEAAPDDPEAVSDDDDDKELGVDAAVDEAVDDVELELEAADEAAADEEAAVASGRLALIQGWTRSSCRVSLSFGLTLKHFRIMSWHSWVSLVRNRNSALQMASSASKGMSPQTMS
jgi:hypothetical protein